MMTPDAVDVLRARYLKRDERGQITETPAEMFHRVAERLATTRGPYPEFADSRQAKAGHPSPSRESVPPHFYGW